MLPHAYSTMIEVSPTSESGEKIEKQTWCSKSDASRECTIYGGEYVQRNVARGELCKPLKIAPIRFGNFSGDLDCMQVAALCMFEGRVIVQGSSLSVSQTWLTRLAVEGVMWRIEVRW